MTRSLQDFDAVQIENVAQSAPARGEVQIQLEAAAFNHRDLWIIRGKYPDVRPPSAVGCDGAGIIARVGDGVDLALAGTKVILYPGLDWGDHPLFPSRSFHLLGGPGPGTVAEMINLPAAHAITMPTYLTWEGAAASPLAALTAWRGLVTKAKLRADERILITGAGGGVAIFAVQLASAMGAEVYVTSRSDETIAKAMALGAKGGFNYTHWNWGNSLPHTSRGFHVVFDSAPATGYPVYSRSTMTGARIVIFGSTGGTAISVDASELFFKNLQVIGTNVGTLDEFRSVLDFMARHRIQPVIDRCFPFEQAKDALIHLKDARAFGKVVVRM